MFEARVWLYVEPIMPTCSRLQLITDLTPDKVLCKLDDFLQSLLSEYQFHRDDVTLIKDLLKIGRSFKVNLVEKSFSASDDSAVVTSAKTIRAPQNRDTNRDFGIINKTIEKEINKKFFSS